MRLNPAFWMPATHSTTRKETVTYTDKKTGETKQKEIEIVNELPPELAKAASVDMETYSLARVIASEGYSGDDYALAMVGIGSVIKNEARRRFKDDPNAITRLLIYSQFPAAKDHYGEQSGRYAATTRDPMKWHVLFAKALLDKDLPDITKGATQFLDPWGPGGTQKNKRLEPFPEVMKRWHSKSAWIGEIPGLDTLSLAFFRPEPDEAKRESALASLLGIWRKRYGGSGQGTPAKPPTPEGH